ncbi:MAG: RES domain-containing protein [Alphaproteobacteria bacterium]|nr:MAG: RES domain-containing protein [Alphaproteobacteria bacterium]
MVSPPVARLVWPRTHRLVMAHYPPVDIYDDIASPEDWALLTAAVQRSNPRIRAAIGDLSLVPVERRLSGPGADGVMAAFTHISPDRVSRFSDGSYGVYYAGESTDTALHEHGFHMGRFYAATDEAPGWIGEVRELVGSIDAALIDLRGGGFGDLLHPDPARYGPAQDFARTARAEGADGIVYPSLRRPGGECIAAFWPDVVSPARQGEHYRYHWDGARIDYARQITGERGIYRLDIRSGC